MYWCFYCYSVNDHPTGPCRVCGKPIEGPTDLSWVDKLIWTLHHPDADRALIAAQTLGKLRAHEAVTALREVAESGADIYLRAEALRSLIAIEGVEPLRSWLGTLSQDAPFNVREIAQQALNGPPQGDTRLPQARPITSHAPSRPAR